MAIFSKKENTEKQEKQPAEKSSPVAGSAKAFAGIIVQPRISEKAAHLSNTGKYVFNVLKKANKIEIKKAVEKSYNVSVIRVNIVSVQGKSRNYGRISGRTSDFKKAIVTLKPGQKIEGATETI